MPQRSHLVLAALLFLACASLCPAASGASAKPNVVYIVADDLGWKDVGFHGSDIQTPNIDKLASDGIRFDQFYTQPMCTPTRACIMTGRYPLRYGLQTAVIFSGHTYGLPTEEWLLPQALHEAGYRSAIIGKWHLGHADAKYWPRQRGFDYQYGPLIGEIDYFTHEQHGVLDWYRDNVRLEERGYSTSLIGRKAVQYIEQQSAEKPFFLYLTFNAPHTPYQAPKEYLDRYASISDPNRRAYAGSITAMDDQIGAVIKTLEAKGLRENTLIVFHSDNGGTRNAKFAGEGDMSKVKIPCDNGPYRDGKGSLYEGGTRVVALLNWPGKINGGGTVEGLVHVVDMYPTLASLAGASTEKCKPLDGMNIWPAVVESQPSPRTEIVYNIEPFRAALRQGEWKLVWRTLLPASVELYNVVQDPSEQMNLAAQYPDHVNALQRRIGELAGEMAKPLTLDAEFEAMRGRLHLPPALPTEPFQLDSEQ